MTTKTIDKIDLSALIGPLDQKPEPKTLQECLAEAGGWPFAAKAICEGTRSPTDDRDPLPVGTEASFNGESIPGYFISDLEPYPRMLRIQSNLPRWQLLGHKT